MTKPTSLEDIAKGLQTFVDSLQTAAKCSKATESILTLKDQVDNLIREAERIDHAGSDFNGYTRGLNRGRNILTDLEAPGKELKRMGAELTLMFHDVVGKKELTNKKFKDIKTHLEKMNQIAKDFAGGMRQFQDKMDEVRKFCVQAWRNAQQEVERLKDQAAREKKAGIQTGSGTAAVGAAASTLGGAALVLGILGLVTGGLGFIAAGVVGVAAGAVGIGGGAYAIAEGASTIQDALLSAAALNKKADKFQKAAVGIQTALRDVDGLIEETQNGIVKLTDDVMQSLAAGLKIYGKLEEDRKKLEESDKKVHLLEDDNKRLKERLAALERQGINNQ